LAILWQVTQVQPEMPCEIDHRHILRQNLAHDLAHAVRRRPIEEALHQVHGEPSALQVGLHDTGKLGHERIVFADEPCDPHGLSPVSFRMAMRAMSRS
jgi:hypothetical protein